MSPIRRHEAVRTIRFFHNQRQAQAMADLIIPILAWNLIALTVSISFKFAARKELHNYDQRHSSLSSYSSSNKESKSPGTSSSSRQRQCSRCLLVHVSENVLLFSYSGSFISDILSSSWTSLTIFFSILVDSTNTSRRWKLRLEQQTTNTYSRRIICQCSTVDLCTRSKSRQWSRSTLCWFFRTVSPTMTQHWTSSFNVINLAIWSNKRCLLHRNELSRSSSLEDVCAWCGLLE